MMKRLNLPLGVVCVLALALSAHAGEVLDRIVATVNGRIILQSDWDDAVRYESFIGGYPLNGSIALDRKAVLDRLIDQELLREQMRSTDAKHAAQAAEVLQQLQAVRKQYPEAVDDAGWHKLLRRYNLNEDILRDHIATQIEITRLVDDRLLPNVQVDANSIETYYNQSLLPQLRKSGAADVPLAEVTVKIKELLTQQRLDQMLADWLQTLRASAEIHVEGISPEKIEVR